MQKILRTFFTFAPFWTKLEQCTTSFFTMGIKIRPLRGTCYHAACAMIENDLNILALLCQSAAGGDEEFWGIIDQVSASHYESLC